MTEKKKTAVARDLMHSPIVTIQTNTTLGDAAKSMIENDVSCLPVVDNDSHVVGIITHSDFAPHHKFLAIAGDMYTMLGEYVTPDTMQDVAHEARQRPVKDLMKTKVVTIQEDTSISDITDLMIRRKVNRLPVLRDKKLVGIITRHDLLKLMMGSIANP